MPAPRSELGDLVRGRAPPPDLRATIDALVDRAPELAIALLGHPNAALSSKQELRFGTNGSLAVVVAGPKAGSYFDHENGVGGDLLTLAMHTRGCGFREALDFARDFCGIVRPRMIREHAVSNKRPDDQAERQRTASFLWSSRNPIEGSAAERYLRVARGYTGPIASTLAYLPARDHYQHALIAAFGVPAEPEPGVLHMPAALGVHLIRLNPDGSDRVRDQRGKITIGQCLTSPIVCAPFSECNNALVIAEGIENALSAHAALGIGAWAAGGASQTPHAERARLHRLHHPHRRRRRRRTTALPYARAPAARTRIRGPPGPTLRDRRVGAMKKTPDANDILRQHGADALRKHIDRATLFVIEGGKDEGGKYEGVSLDDFYAYMPEHSLHLRADQRDVAGEPASMRASSGPCRRRATVLDDKGEPEDDLGQRSGSTRTGPSSR